MKIGIIGSGIVGQVVGAKLAQMGHDVVLGTRDPGKLDEKKGMGASLGEWLTTTGHGARVGTFADAAAHGEMLINATLGQVSVDALTQAGAAHLSGKVLIDISNDLDFSRGMPPTTGTTDRPNGSVGERIQTAFPQARVVKALNTMNAYIMVDPKLVPGDSTVLICGNDAAAKAQVTDLLRSFGWSDVFDLGDITGARATEMLMPLWLRAWGNIGNSPFNLKIVR